MNWSMIAQALFLGAMLVFLYPSVKRALENPDESKGDWKSILIPLLLVLGIVSLLIISVM